MEYQLCVACNRKVPRKSKSCPCGHVLREKVAVKISNKEEKVVSQEEELQLMMKQEKQRRPRKPQSTSRRKRLQVRTQLVGVEKGKARKKKATVVHSYLLSRKGLLGKHPPHCDGLEHEQGAGNQENADCQPQALFQGLSISSKHYPNPLEDINTKLVRQNWFLFA